MSNLLDKASIILTPTAYNNGEALCVKPSDGSGDFDFSRNSAATRVNAQGLVENVQILSSNLVQNGDFSEEGVQEVSNGSFSQEGAEEIVNGGFDTDLSGWTYSNDVIWNNGKAQVNALDGAFKYIEQQITSSGTVTYKISFDVSNIQGVLQVIFANNLVTEQSTNGSFEVYYTTSETNPRVQFKRKVGTTTFFEIDNVSVREVGQDWSLGTGWSIGEDKLNFTNVNGSSNQSGVFVIGKTYKITCDYVFTSGTRLILPYDGSNFNSDIVINTPSSAIGYTYYYTPLGGNALFTYSDGNGNGSITNISVKEVGQNWDLGTGWSIGEDKAVAVSGSATKLQQTISGLSGKKCSVTFTLSDYQGTDLVLLDFGSTSGQSITANGTYTEIGTYDQNYFQLYKGANFSGNITNISVIEITDDTNLPRINYEGFSYQDALGSEEITNGDFSSDTAWNKNGAVTISGGTANFNNSASGNNVEQAVTLPSGKQYIATYEITSITEGKFSIYVGGVLSGNQNNQVGVYTEVFTSIGGNAVYVRARGTTTGSIDNVSVKEYLGQEVVPDSGCGSWLFEPQSTNLVTQSELFSDSYWSKINSSVTSGFSSPSGGLNAFKLVENTSLGNHVVRKSGLTTASTTTTSIFAKAEQRNKILLFNGVAGYGFNLSNGTTFATSTGIPDAFNITELNNGWYKCSITHSSANRCSVYLINDADSFSYTGDGTSGVYIFGAQVELGTGTSYIPTSGSTVTRNQDVCTNGGSLASINSTEGTLYAEIVALANDLTDRTIALSDGTTSNTVRIQYLTVSNAIWATVTNIGAGGNQAILQYTSPDITINSKVALKYKANDFSLWVNGIEVATDTSGVTFSANTLNTLQFDRGNGAQNFFGKTKALAVWKEALSDEELQSLTTI